MFRHDGEASFGPRAHGDIDAGVEDQGKRNPRGAPDERLPPLDHIVVEISLTGPLTEEQRAALLAVAHKCPVHRTLTSEIKIAVRFADGEKRPAA